MKDELPSFRGHLLDNVSCQSSIYIFCKVDRLGANYGGNLFSAGEEVVGFLFVQHGGVGFGFVGGSGGAQR